MVMKNIFESCAAPLLGYKREVGIGFVIVVGLLGAVVGYKTYVTRRESKEAQQAFAECLRENQRALQLKKPEQWADVEKIFGLGYEHHSQSYLGPYFLAYKAEALLRQRKHSQALAVMDEMMGVLAANSPLYHTYKTKYALMRLDSDDSTLHIAGLNELTSLANDKENSFRDLALYHLGYYYWAHNEVEKAQSVWQDLINSYRKGQDDFSSPWAQLAHTKLQYNV